MPRVKRIYDVEIESNGFEVDHREYKRLFQCRGLWVNCRDDAKIDIEHFIWRITVYAVPDGSIRVSLDSSSGLELTTNLVFGHHAAKWLAAALIEMADSAEQQYVAAAEKRRSRPRKRRSATPKSP